MTLGTRQAYLPGGRRTGAPGKHVVRGKAKYRLLDENVRFFVAPPVEEISSSLVRRVVLSSSWRMGFTPFLYVSGIASTIR